MRDRTGRGFRQIGIAAMTVAALAACSSGPSNDAAGNGQGEAATGATNGSGPVQVVYAAVYDQWQVPIFTNSVGLHS